MADLYADVIIGISHEQFDKSFQYRVPTYMHTELLLGAAVEVPFGRGNVLKEAYVIGLSDAPKIEASKIKDIIKIKAGSEIPEAKMIALAAWIKSYYGGTMSKALKTVLPVREEVKLKKVRILYLTDNKPMVESYLERMKKRKAVARVRLLEALIETNSISYEALKDKLGISLKTVKDLLAAGLISIEEKEVYRNPISYIKKEESHFNLNEEQRNVVDTVINDFKKEEVGTYLLHGVTGSGKTLCYIEIIDEVIKSGRQAIVLIPEIALTFQTVQRFYNRFQDRVSILNSKMSKGERYDQFLRAARGEIDCIIGPRSALFTPFKDIGLIVIDEEHEESYRSENVPRYHAREVAAHIAKEYKASLILGSATPSISSFYRARKGDYKLLTMKNRAKSEAKLPEVKIEDMRIELAEGNRQIFSRDLMKALDNTLKKSEQAMIFINKRGYAGFISCRACGYVIKCPHCDVSLNYHKNGQLICHYCGHEEKMVKKCPECNSPYIAAFKVGTQQVEDKLQALYPEAKILRMDKDTTIKKDSYEKILSAFANHEADILVGTQMIVKGHDFANVTLVAAIAADMSLFMGDYRASERTFQLLSQAAGRAGRAGKEGQVFIQTYKADNSCLQKIKEHNYIAFYEEEIAFRERMLYPPVWEMLTIFFSSKDERVLQEAVASISESDFLKSWEEDLAGRVQVIGPSKDSIYKLEDEYRMLLYVKAKDNGDISYLKEKIDNFVKDNPKFNYVFLQYDRT